MSDQRGSALAVAAASMFFFVSVAAVVVVLGWIGLSIYAIVKATGSGSDEPSATVVVLFIVLLVGTLVTAFLGSIALIGRGLTPKKRKDREAEQLAFAIPED